MFIGNERNGCRVDETYCTEFCLCFCCVVPYNVRMKSIYISDARSMLFTFIATVIALPVGANCSPCKYARNKLAFTACYTHLTTAAHASRLLRITVF